LRAVLQRVSRARVVVEGDEIGAIGPGWLVLLGVGPGDTPAVADGLADKIVKLRAFEDQAGKLNLSAADVGAQFLVVSQFTLYADLSRGRRPSFVGAAPPAQAEPLVDYVVQRLLQRGFRVATGRFSALMEVELTNHGPVTFVLSTEPWV
jgi:D-tyrosyl-tRNA(Tyr) deacylase